MNIIILGCNAVSASLVENLTREDNNLTVIDENETLLRELQDRLDIRTVKGMGSHPSVLKQAGAANADMLIAISESDEVNMVACQLAHTLFGVQTKIARVKAKEYLEYKELFDDSALPIDVLISPEQLVTEYVLRLIEHPGALQVLDFAKGQVKLIVVKTTYDAPLVGKPLSRLKDNLPHVSCNVVAIYRRGLAISAMQDTIVETDDELFIVAASKDISAIISEVGRKERDYKRMMIAGGGNIGCRLAQALEKKMRVKVIEHNRERLEVISSELTTSLVLLGDASDRDLLIEENIEDTDVFCAVTNDDEANILSAMQAKRLGARKVMALVNRTAYIDLVQGSIIDIAISPQHATTSGVLSYIRLGDVVKDYSLRHGTAEAIEAVAHGDENSSRVIGKRIRDVKLPPGTTAGALVRQGQVLFDFEDEMIEPEDHIVLFLAERGRIHDIEQLFQIY